MKQFFAPKLRIEQLMFTTRDHGDLLSLDELIVSTILNTRQGEHPLTASSIKTGNAVFLLSNALLRSASKQLAPLAACVAPLLEHKLQQHSSAWPSRAAQWMSGFIPGKVIRLHSIFGC